MRGPEQLLCMLQSTLVWNPQTSAHSADFVATRLITALGIILVSRGRILPFSKLYFITVSTTKINTGNGFNNNILFSWP